MKIIITLVVTFFLTPVHAKIFKCINSGNTTYQQTECKRKGTEFTPVKDITTKQQTSAVKKLTSDIETGNEKKKLQKEVDDKERLLRAQEDNANAALENAMANRAQAEEIARQTKVLKENNGQLRNVYPFSPIVKQKPALPIVNPLPDRPTLPTPSSPSQPLSNRPVPTPLSERAQPLPMNR